MKRLNHTHTIVIVATLAAFILGSCATSPPSDTPPAADEPVQPQSIWEQAPHLFSTGLGAGDEVRAPFGGQVVSVEPDGPSSELVAIAAVQEYYLAGQRRSTTYELVIGGLEAGVEPGVIVERGAAIGTAVGQVTFAARAETLDPWLVRTSSDSGFVDGAWWFQPNWLDPTHPQLLTFRQIDSILPIIDELIADAESSDASGVVLTYRPQHDRIRFPLALDAYPDPLVRTPTLDAIEMQYYRQAGVFQFSQVGLSRGEWDVVLYWQGGFEAYLDDEYTLGEPIWLYGGVMGVDVGRKEIIVFLRDFALEPDEEIIARRTLRLQEMRESGAWDAR